jgi:hypothetical protein
MDSTQPKPLNDQVSDLAARIARLEAARPEPRIGNQASETLTLFPSPIVLLDGISNATSYTDSTSASYVPKTAKYAVLWCAFEDTNGGTGRSVLWGKAGSVEKYLSTIYEGVISGASGEVLMPVLNGRFDYRVEFGSGGSDARLLIALHGYIT